MHNTAFGLCTTLRHKDYVIFLIIILKARNIGDKQLHQRHNEKLSVGSTYSITIQRQPGVNQPEHTKNTQIYLLPSTKMHAATYAFTLWHDFPACCLIKHRKIHRILRFWNFQILETYSSRNIVPPMLKNLGKFCVPDFDIIIFQWKKCRRQWFF